MFERSTILWESAQSELHRIGMGEGLPYDLATIRNGDVGLDFYTAPADGLVVALGWGTGAYVLRLATWNSQRRVICVEPDPILRDEATRLVRRLGLDRVSICDQFEDALPALELVGLLLVDERRARTTLIRAALQRWDVVAVVGFYRAHDCDDADIYRVCIGRSAAFHLINRTSGRHVVGRRHVGPDVSVVICDVDGQAEPFDVTVESLLRQQDITAEVLVAVSAGSCLLSACEAWAEGRATVRVVVGATSQEAVAAALVQARGLYVGVISCGDECDPHMYARFFNKAAPGRADVLVGSYSEICYADGAVEARYGFASLGWDLRSAHTTGRTEGALRAVDLRPMLGRCLFRRAFMQNAGLAWPADLEEHAPALFLLHCLLQAQAVDAVAHAYLTHRQTFQESIGAASRIGDLERAKRIEAALVTIALERDGNYTRELVLRNLLLSLYTQLYLESTSLRERLSAMRRLLMASLDEMCYGSRGEFIARKALGPLIRLLR